MKQGYRGKNKAFFVKAAIEESNGDNGMKHAYVLVCFLSSLLIWARLITYIYPIFLLSQSVQVKVKLSNERLLINK
jgi:hypothetical protein